MKLNITAIGTPKTIQTSRGSATKNYLKAVEYNDKFLNYFVNKTTEKWAVGQVVEVEAVEEQQYISKKDGSQQISYNIKLPRFGGNQDVMKALERIENRLVAIPLLVKMVEEIGRAVVPKPKDAIDYPELKEEPNFDVPLSDDEAEALYNGN